MDNIYYPRGTVVTDIKEDTPTIKTFHFELDEPLTYKAGQFMQLTVPGIGEAPFTPSSCPGEVREMEITILQTGRVTDALHNEVKVGDKLGLRGPFGKGYPMERFAGKEILIVGGGVGLAPLRSLIYALFDRIDDFKKISICYGAKTPYDLCFRDEFDEWTKKPNTSLNLTIDNPHPDWDGTVGLVTCLLEKERIERLERERIEREKQEKERKERERRERIRLEKERKAQQQLEKERLKKIEREKRERLRLERERLEKERQEQEAIEKEKQELERLKRERKQKEKEAKLEAKKRKKLDKQKKKIEKKKLKEQEKLKNL